MVRIIPSKQFVKKVKTLDHSDRLKVEKQIRKILDNPGVGKPLKYRRSERSLYVRPFRLIYAKRGEDIILLKFDHRKRAYG